MRKLLQIMGVLLIISGLWSLLNSDWVSFGISSTLGIYMLLEPHRSKGMLKLRWILLIIGFVLVVIKLASIL